MTLSYRLKKSLNLLLSAQKKSNAKSKLFERTLISLGAGLGLTSLILTLF